MVILDGIKGFFGGPYLLKSFFLKVCTGFGFVLFFRKDFGVAPSQAKRFYSGCLQDL